jgi:hypothetical protein
MVNRISYRQSTIDWSGDIAGIIVPPSGYEVASPLFFGDGVQEGTLRYIDSATGEWVTEATWMVNSGLVGTGTPQEVIFRDQPTVHVNAAFDAHNAFTAIAGIGSEGPFVLAYLRFFGIRAIDFNWDNTAEHPDEATARAEFAANAAAAAADYLAQIQAILDTPVAGRVDNYFWGIDDASVPGTVMGFTPDPDTTLTYGDFLDVFQGPGGRTYIGTPPTRRPPDFGPDEAVEILLTNNPDYIHGNAFGAGTLSIDAGRGDDELRMFLEQGDLQPDLLLIYGAGGDDTVSVGAFLDTQIDGGTGNDNIRLDVEGSESIETHNILSGGAGRDIVIGAEFGTNLIYGGYGQDQLLGGLLADTIHGGDHADVMEGNDGDDLLHGDHGQDTLYGSDGQDTLDGGIGNDVLYGEAGVDTFHFGPGSGKDKIYGYEAGEVIEIDASFWSGSVADFIAVNVHVNGSGILTIKLSATDNIRVMDGGFVPGDFADAILFV